MFLGIMVLVVAVLVVYFESKSREQNHKIASMFSIVSTLAEDMNQMKFAVGHIANQGFSGPTLEENTRPFTMQSGGQLIEVSDNESDDSDEEEEEEEEEEESDSDSDSESDSDDEEHVDVKVLKISNEQELDEQEADELDDSSSSSSALDINEDVLEELEPTLESEVVESVSGMKTISIDLEDDESEESVDYKKLSLQKLKSVVVEKGLVVDASKLKKPELLKLLGIE